MPRRQPPLRERLEPALTASNRAIALEVEAEPRARRHGRDAGRHRVRPRRPGVDQRRRQPALSVARAARSRSSTRTIRWRRCSTSWPRRQDHGRAGAQRLAPAHAALRRHRRGDRARRSRRTSRWRSKPATHVVLASDGIHTLDEAEIARIVAAYRRRRPAGDRGGARAQRRKPARSRIRTTSRSSWFRSTLPRRRLPELTSRPVFRAVANHRLLNVILGRHASCPRKTAHEPMSRLRSSAARH